MKKVFLILIIFFIGLGASLLFFSTRPEPKHVPFPVAIRPSPTIPAPSFPEPISTGQPTYSVVGQVISFPKEVTSYILLKKPLASLALPIATALGFTQQPESITSARGEFYLWNEGAASLTVGSDPLEISYHSGVNPTDNITRPVPEIEAVAQKRLSSIVSPGPELSLIREGIRFLTINGSSFHEAGSASQATVARFSYGYTLDNRPLFTHYADTPNVFVDVDSAGNVVSFNALLFPLVIKQGASVPIISVGEATSRLTNNDGVLLSLVAPADKNSEETPDYVVSASDIREVLLGYYYAANATNASPVYLFRGEGKDARTQKLVKTTTVVSALPVSSTK